MKYNLDYNDVITIDTSVRMKPGVTALTNITNTANGQESAGTTSLACDQGLVADTNDLDGDGSTVEMICSAPASFALPKLATFESSKWVNGVADPATTWTRFPAEGQTTVSADGYATYHLFMKPVGNVDTTHIELVDVLPVIGEHCCFRTIACTAFRVGTSSCWSTEHRHPQARSGYPGCALELERRNRLDSCGIGDRQVTLEHQPLSSDR